MKQSVWPCPVYEAEFADGTIGRMSFWTQANKPFDFDRGRRLCEWAWQQPVVKGRAEHNGLSYIDPHFSGNVVSMLPKREAPGVAKTIAALAKALGVEECELRNLLAEAA